MSFDNWIPLLLPVLFLIGFPFVFVGFWCFVVWLLSFLGGWQRLATFYRAEAPFAGQPWKGRSARLGLVNYRSILTLGADSTGLYLAVMPLFRIGHAPLWIPWSEIEVIERDGILTLYTGFHFVQTPATILYMLPNLAGQVLAERDVQHVAHSFDNGG